MSIDRIRTFSKTVACKADTMKSVRLTRGQGMRLIEETGNKPKPMVEIAASHSEKPSS